MTSAASAGGLVDMVSSAACGVSCAHCDQPVPAGLVEPGAAQQFCCGGCRTVYAILAGHGLDTYYRVRDAVGEAGVPAATSNAAYEDYDNAAFLAAFATALPRGEMEATLQLRGVHCAACVWLVERVDRVTPGVVSCRLDFRRALATVRWNPAHTGLAAVARGLDSLGYPSMPPRALGGERARRLEDRRHLIGVGVAGAIAGNVMLLSLALYAGLFDGISSEFRHLFRMLSAVLGVLSLAWPGRVFFRGAWAALRTRAPHLDVPIALALLVGGVWGSVNALRGAGEVYFDSITVLVFLLLVGRWIQHAQQRRAADAIELLFTTTPTSARRVSEEAGVETVRAVPSDTLQAGDVIEVRAGEALAADGELLTDAAELDESLISGESEPRRAVAGAALLAGSLSTTGMLRLRVTAAGSETRVARLMRLVADASSQRSAIVRMADRIAGRFVLVVMSLAAMTGVAWAFVDPARAVEHATALLIVSCPCALGLATPLVITASIGALARRGVLVRGGDALEKLARPGVLLLDKTGTLTEGGLSLASAWGDEAAAAAVAAIERQSSHRVAEALAHGLVGADVLEAKDVREHQGRGILGVVAGEPWCVGSAAFMQERGAAIPALCERWVDEQAAAGRHVTLAARGHQVVAAYALAGERLREDAGAVLDKLRSRGWTAAIVSGDRRERVMSVAAALRIDAAACEAGVPPERKLERVREELRLDRSPRGPVVMVGDGVNDAAALSAADVGVAVHGGAEASLQAADVSISRPGLSPLLELIDAGRGAVRRIRVCMAASLAYNALAIGLAMLGLLHPLLAAVLMPISSITVVAIAASGGVTAKRKGRAS